jgi:hypothetical protein
MQAIGDLSELPPAATQAVIINCGTKWVSSLALLSALRNTGSQVLLVDCESRDGSKAHFEQLSVRYRLPFFWLDWPLRPHPATLDRLFAELTSETVLLIDSDVEIKTPDVFDAMRSALARDRDAYGAGFLQGPAWLGAEHGLPAFTGYYAERMWIPCVLLRTAAIRRALDAGLSFMNRRPFFEIASYPRLSRLLGYRYRVRGLRHLRLPDAGTVGRGKRPTYDGRYPAFVEYDTGADLHHELKRRGQSFAALPPERWGEVHHYHGVTRAHLTGSLRRAAKALRLVSRDTETEQRSVLATVKQRLGAVYGVAEV